MKNLATLLAATAVALSGAALANTPGAPQAPAPAAPSADAPQLPKVPQSSPDAQAQQAPEASGKPAEGFVVLQRNIYVPVDAEGKVASNDWVVVDRQGFVTADELKAAEAEARKNGELPEDHAQAPEAGSGTTPEEPAASPSPRTEPAVRLPALGGGSMIRS